MTDVPPLPPAVPDGVLETLLHRVVDDHADADVLAAPSALPGETLRTADFHSDARPPQSYVANRTTHVVRSLTGEWTIDGADLTDQGNWRLTFSEQETS